MDGAEPVLLYGQGDWILGLLFCLYSKNNLQTLAGARVVDARRVFHYTTLSAFCQANSDLIF
jgi:hypothetical protein